MIVKFSQDPVADDRACEDFPPDARAMASEEGSHLRGLVARLPQRQREVGETEI
jgi:hypothetical protein